MGKSTIEKLAEVRRNHETALICFFNDGSVREEEVYSARRIKEAGDKDQFEEIEKVLCDAADSYARRDGDFDTINMSLLLGLIYDKDDVDSKNRILPGAKPVNGVVRYYTGSVKSFKDGKRTNKFDFEEYGIGRQSYIKFDTLVEAIHKSGLNYTGPETFEDFSALVLSGEKFDIIMSANLGAKSNGNQKSIGQM